MTPDQQQLLDTIAEFLEPRPDVQAAWLSGSLGAGHGDAFSDVDVLVLVSDGAASKASSSIVADLGSIAPTIMVNRLFGGRVLSVITDDWRRFDLVFVESSDLARYNARDLTVLFNHGSHSPPSHQVPPYQTSPDQLLTLVNEFLRVLGLTVVALGRGEYELALTGLDLLRRSTLDIMLEENGVSPSQRGGALRRLPFLHADQINELRALPPLMAERSSVLAGADAIAKIFLPRARRHADRIGMIWPQALEDATRRHLARNLGLAI